MYCSDGPAFKRCLPLPVRRPANRVTIAAFCAWATYLGPAADPLKVSSLVCLSFDQAFSCDVMTSGGLAPLDVRWIVGGAHLPAFDDRPSVTGRCRPNIDDTTVPVTVVGRGHRSGRRPRSTVGQSGAAPYSRASSSARAPSASSVLPA